MSNQVHTPNVKLPALDAMVAASKAGKRLAEAATTVETKIAADADALAAIADDPTVKNAIDRLAKARALLAAQIDAATATVMAEAAKVAPTSAKAS
jgi:hypothetical protein